MIYILSTGRAGTNLLQSVLEHTNQQLRIDHQKRGSRALNIAGNWLIRRQDSYHYMSPLFWLIRRSRTPQSTADPLLSVPITILLTNEDARGELSPHKLVHLVRDPRDFVTSFINWKQQSKRRRFLHRYVPLWQPLPPEHPAISRQRMSKFEQFCWVWNFKNELFQDLRKTCHQYLFVRLEDLSSAEDDFASIRRVLEFLDLTMDEDLFPGLLTDRVNRSQTTCFPRWQEWTPQQAQILNRHCADRMMAYGYGQEPQWRALLPATLRSQTVSKGWLG